MKINGDRKMKCKWMILFVLTMLLFLGCSKKEEIESKNMEQIYKEDGIPVNVVEMQPQEYSVELPFTATLSGLRQSAATAMIGGRIEKVHVEVGDYVKKDQVMFEFPEDAPAGQLTQATSAFDLANSTYQRMQNLYEKGGISKQDLDGVETQYKVAEANLDAVMQMLKVRAPIDGYVITINVRETDGVHGEDVLAVVSQTKQMKARILTTEDEVSQIKKGQKATVIWNDVLLNGEVTEVAMAMDFATRAFGVDLVFDNPDNLCKAGVIGDIRIQTYKNKNALLVPRKNVMNDENGSFVYVVLDGKAKKQFVVAGHDNGDLEIIKGLKTGDIVIVKGHNMVHENSKVNVVK